MSRASCSQRRSGKRSAAQPDTDGRRNGDALMLLHACCVEGTLPACRAGLPRHIADDGFGRDAARILAPPVVVVVVVVVVVFAAPGAAQGRLRRA